jgi:hypothetical protein
VSDLLLIPVCAHDQRYFSGRSDRLTLDIDICLLTAEGMPGVDLILC